MITQLCGNAPGGFRVLDSPAQRHRRPHRLALGNRAGFCDGHDAAKVSPARRILKLRGEVLKALSTTSSHEVAACSFAWFNVRHPVGWAARDVQRIFWRCNAYAWFLRWPTCGARWDLGQVPKLGSHRLSPFWTPGSRVVGMRGTQVSCLEHRDSSDDNTRHTRPAL